MEEVQLHFLMVAIGNWINHTQHILDCVTWEGICLKLMLYLCMMWGGVLSLNVNRCDKRRGEIKQRERKSRSQHKFQLNCKKKPDLLSSKQPRSIH